MNLDEFLKLPDDWKVSQLVKSEDLLTPFRVQNYSLTDVALSIAYDFNSKICDLESEIFDNHDWRIGPFSPTKIKYREEVWGIIKTYHSRVERLNHIKDRQSLFIDEMKRISLLKQKLEGECNESK